MSDAGKYYLFQGKVHAINSPKEEFIHKLLSWVSSSIMLKWRSSGTRIPFFNTQYARLLHIITCLDKEIDNIPEENIFHDLLIRLIQRNRLFKGVELRIYLRPDPDDPRGIQILIMCHEYSEDKFCLNNRGLLLALAQPSHHPGFNEMLRISQEGFAASKWKIQAHEREVDALYFSNQNNLLLETTHSRIFLIKGNRIFTPDYQKLNRWGIESGIESAASSIGLNFARSASIQKEHLNQADELFLANDFDGIQWVMGYEDKRFFRKHSPMILKIINQQWESPN